MMDRLFNEEPTRDGYEQVGRVIGNITGISVMLAMTWVVARGLA